VEERVGVEGGIEVVGGVIADPPVMVEGRQRELTAKH